MSMAREEETVARLLANVDATPFFCAHNLSRSALDQIYGTSEQRERYVWRPSPHSLPPSLSLHFTVARCSFFL